MNQIIKKLFLKHIIFLIILPLSVTSLAPAIPITPKAIDLKISEFNKSLAVLQKDQDATVKQIEDLKTLAEQKIREQIDIQKFLAKKVGEEAAKIAANKTDAQKAAQMAAIQKLEEKRDEIRKKLIAQEAAAAKTPEAVKQIEAYKTQNAKLKEYIKNLREKTIPSLQKEIERLKSQALSPQASAAQVAEITQLKTQLTEQQSTMQNLQRELENAKQQLATTKLELENAQRTRSVTAGPPVKETKYFQSRETKETAPKETLVQTAARKAREAASGAKRKALGAVSKVSVKTRDVIAKGKQFAGSLIRSLKEVSSQIRTGDFNYKKLGEINAAEKRYSKYSTAIKDLYNKKIKLAGTPAFISSIAEFNNLLKQEASMILKIQDLTLKKNASTRFSKLLKYHKKDLVVNKNRPKDGLRVITLPVFNSILAKLR